jgi:hypothetical protein
MKNLLEEIKENCTIGIVLISFAFFVVAITMPFWMAAIEHTIDKF